MNVRSFGLPNIPFKTRQLNQVAPQYNQFKVPQFGVKPEKGENIPTTQTPSHGLAQDSPKPVKTEISEESEVETSDGEPDSTTMRSHGDIHGLNGRKPL